MHTITVCIQEEKMLSRSSPWQAYRNAIALAACKHYTLIGVNKAIENGLNTAIENQDNRKGGPGNNFFKGEKK